MSDDAGRFGPRLYGLFDDLDEESSEDDTEDGRAEPPAPE